MGVRAVQTFFSYHAGRSRYGKTETAIGQFVALALAGYGGLFIDPHADAIAEIKAYLTDPDVAGRVVEIDASDRATRQPAWNLFAVPTGTQTEAAGRVEAFVDALATTLGWDDRNTRALNLATQAATALTQLSLAAGDPALAPTIFQVPTLLSDEHWRTAALRHLDAGTREFFEQRFPRLPAEAITAVTNLIDRLHAAQPVAALLGRPASTFDAARALRENLIVLACPGPGSTRDRLLANLLVYDVLHACRSRATLPPHARRPFWVFLDELQTYDGPNLPALLEQSAKYGGRAFLFNQNPERLTSATWNAVSTNRSHLASTTVNARAARMIAAEWGTKPGPEVLTRLERYTYLASVTHGAQVTRPFLVHGIPAPDASPRPPPPRPHLGARADHRPHRRTHPHRPSPGGGPRPRAAAARLAHQPRNPAPAGFGDAHPRPPTRRAAGGHPAMTATASPAGGRALAPVSGPVLESLYQHRVLSTRQLRAMHAPAAGPRWMQRVMAALADAGLVGFVRVGRGAPRLYHLTASGADAVELIPTRTEPRRRLDHRRARSRPAARPHAGGQRHRHRVHDRRP